METVKVNTSQHIDIDYPVAGLGERTSARLIDLGLLGVVAIIVLIILMTTGLWNSEGISFIVILSIYGGGFVFYDLLCEIFMNGQSVGKKLLKIKVISLDGSQPSLGQYFIRWIFRIVDFTFLTGGVGGFISVAVTENKQRIGDIVAGTTLIKTVPRTKLENIAFHPVNEDYTPSYTNVNLLSDRDIELIHEVLSTYYKTNNPDIVYHMANKVSNHLGISNLPENVNAMDFLRTVVMDYNQVTSRSV